MNKSIDAGEDRKDRRQIKGSNMLIKRKPIVSDRIYDLQSIYPTSVEVIDRKAGVRNSATAVS